MKPYTIAISGKRPKDLYGYNDRKAYSPLIIKIQEVLMAIAQNHVADTICVRTGGAQGTDQLTFWCVDSLKTKPTHFTWINDVYIPYIGQDGRWADKGMFSRDSFARMLKCADHVIDTSTVNCKATNVVGKLMHRNDVMVDGADCLIAVCPHDTIYDTHGGTQNAIRHAIAQNIPVHVIDPTNLEKEPITIAPITDDEIPF